MAGRSRKSRLFRTSLFIAVQVAATFLFLEVALRLIRPHHAGLSNVLYLPSVSTNLSRIHDTVDLVKRAMPGLEPGQVAAGFVLNSRCLRTHEYSVERSGGLRVVALGDSFTWGDVLFDDTWPVQLQAGLRKTLNRNDVEVISLGLPGVGPKYYLRMWELEGRKLQPDLVVVGFFIGNDLTDHSKSRPKTSRHGWLVEHSLAVRAVRNLVLVARSGVNTDGEEGNEEVLQPATPGRLGYELPGHAEGFDPTHETFDEEAFMRIEWRRMAICLESNRPMVWKLLRNAAPFLKELDRSVKASGAELVIYLIPDEFQVNDELSTRLLEMHDTDPAEFIRDMPQKIMARFLKQTDIHYIDGLQRFRAQNSTENLFLPRNTHWNAAGNHLAATMMVDYLHTSGLLP